MVDTKYLLAIANRLRDSRDQSILNMAEPEQTASQIEELIDHDDLCHICHLLLLHPVTTHCNHTFCRSCFSHWTDISTSTTSNRIQLIQGVDIDFEGDIDEQINSPFQHQPTFPDPQPNTQTRCPMCRTLTTADFNPHLDTILASRYPVTYQARIQDYQQQQERRLTSQTPRQVQIRSGTTDDTGPSVLPLILSIGNSHKLVRHESESRNKHEWNFFVRPSRTDIIENVHVSLHPTFRSSEITLRRPPYSLRRVGWGTFTILVNLKLKQGFIWASPSPVGVVDPGEGEGTRDMPFEWYLDFDGRGSYARWRLEVRKDDDEILRRANNAESGQAERTTV